jgi:hypothetical protein
MDGALPTAPDPADPADFYNYDAERNDSPGLTIARGGSGPDEIDNSKHQHWVTAPFSAALVIEGDASVKLWTAMKDFSEGLGGAVTVYLRDCEGWDCVELGSDTVARANWQAGSSWTLETLSVPIGTHTVAPGHHLELVVVVDASSGDDMWFAYDTNSRKSRVTVVASSDALTVGVEPARLLSGWLAGSWARLLFA